MASAEEFVVTPYNFEPEYEEGEESREQLQNTPPQLTTIVSPMRHLLKNET